MLNILNLIIMLWLHKRIPLFFGEFQSRIKGTRGLKLTLNCYRKKCVSLCFCVCVCMAHSGSGKKARILIHKMYKFISLKL